MKKILFLILAVIPFLLHAQDINYTDGNCVSGNCQNGQGVYVFNNGDTYSGAFSNGKFNGQGKYTYKSGAIYEGSYINHQKSGKGVFTYSQISNKLKYVGDFSKGNFNGYGILIYKDGYSLSCEWKDDKAVIGALQGVPAYWDANNIVIIGDKKYEVDKQQMQHIDGYETTGKDYPASEVAITKSTDYFDIKDGDFILGSVMFEKSETGYPRQKTLKVFLNAKNCSNDITILNSLITSMPDVGKIVDCVNKACESALREHLKTYPQNLFKIIVSQSTIAEPSETAILQIMHCLDSKDYVDFLKYLEANDNEVLKKLVNKLNDKTLRLFGSNNYTSFIKELIRMYNYDDKAVRNFWASRFPDIGNEKLFGQIINLYPKPFKSDAQTSLSSYWNPKPYEFRFSGIFNKDGTVDIYKEEHISYPTYSQAGTVGIPSWSKNKITTLKPLDPIIILTDKELDVIQTALKEGQYTNSIFIVPAIFLEYKRQKDLNQELVDAGAIVLDIASIYFTAGSSALATKAHWIRKVWAWAGMIGSAGDILNRTGVTNGKIAEAIDIYNDCLFYISVVGYVIPAKSVKMLPINTRSMGTLSREIKENRSLTPLYKSTYIQNGFSAWVKAVEKLEEKDLKNDEAGRNTLKEQFAFIQECGGFDEATEKKIMELLSIASEKTSKNSFQNNFVETKKSLKTPDGKQFIIFSFPTTLTSSYDEQFDAITGDTFEGEMKNGKVIQGTVTRNGKVVKMFFNKSNF